MQDFAMLEWIRRQAEGICRTAFAARKALSWSGLVSQITYPEVLVPILSQLGALFIHW